jgi:cholesterol transport system auxiliary component
MKWTHIKLWGTAIAMLLFATACHSPLGPTGGSAPDKEYLLQWEQAGEATNKLNPACPTLLLSSPRAAPGYAGARMAYMQEPHRIDYFADHRWADSPARMLEPNLMRALETSGLFQAVVRAPTTAKFELRLDTEVLKLVQVFESNESRIDLSVRISLLDKQQQRVLVSEVLQVSEPADEQTPYGGVKAANRAVDRLMQQLQQILRPAVEPLCR